MNPDKFAQYFYDQGVAAAVDNVSRKSKNINMECRQQSQTVSKDGMKISPSEVSMIVEEDSKLEVLKNN